MASRGDHEISGASPESPKAGLWGCLTIIGLLFLVVMFARSCETAPTSSTTPAPAKGRTAVFESAYLVSSQLLLVLGGTSYDISYQTAPDNTALPSPGSPNVFFADFSTGQTWGKAATATTFILSGAVKLTISDIGEQDQMQAQIARTGPNISAYFNYSRSPRGPPSLVRGGLVRKSVIIVGELKEIKFPAGHGQSHQRIDILDLDPSDKPYDLENDVPPVPSHPFELRRRNPDVDDPNRNRFGDPAPRPYRPREAPYHPAPHPVL